MEILVSCAAKIGEGLVEPTGRQFGYFIYYNSYIDDLRKQLERLANKKNELMISIDEKKRNGEIIRDVVKDWVEKVDGFEKEALKFIEDEEKAEKKCFRGWFPDLITRYRLGKEAKQKTMKVIELQQDGDAFDIISTPAPPSGPLLYISDTTIYKTTENAMSVVMESLKNENINFIGIHGMGGVGKTTLVKKIQKNVTEEKLFDKTVMVVISQNVDERNIQGQLADMLGVKLNEETVQGRASRLFDALMAVKMILVILDDVWGRLDFEAVGIPFGDQHTGCKVIITTRNANVCRTLGSQRWKLKMVPLYCLSDQDSWDLFKKNAPDVRGSSKLSRVAQEISRECGGLPLALVTLGRALTGKDLIEWEMATQELKKSASMNIPGVDDKLVNCLKLSYDKLKQEYAKDLFLLCSLFPEDSDILIEDLVLYGFGMEMFQNIATIQEARRIAKSMIKYLQDVSLLLESGEEGCTKMHDVVRDVALSIGSSKYLVRAGVHTSKWPNLKQVNHYIGMSLMKTGIEEPHPLLECPTLQILLLRDNPIGRKVHTTRLFERMEVLKVLDMRRTGFYGREEIATDEQLGIFHLFVGDLKCLTTLILDGNQFTDTSFLGEIKTLEVLSLKFCEFYNKEIKGLNLLTKLRYLDISENYSYGMRSPLKIPSNVMSSLSKLEELYLQGTLTDPKVESILNLFPCLRVLTISVPGFKKPWPHDIIFPDLEVFVVWIGPKSLTRSNKVWAVPNTLVVDHDMFDGLEKLIRKLSKRTNRLSVRQSKGTKNIIPNLLSFDDDGGRETSSQLETIIISDCEDFEYLIDNSKLEKKRLHDDPLLLFANLRVLYIWNCPKLKTILEYSSVAQTSLMNLEELTVRGCNVVEEIIDSSENGELESETNNVRVQQQQQDKIIVFNSLKKLRLSNLESLKAFCLFRTVCFEYPLLESVDVRRCPKMKTFSCGTLSTPKLKVIILDDARIDLQQGMDLNMVIQNHFKES